MSSIAYMEYQKTAIETISPGKLLLMLYDAAVNSLTQAQMALEKNDINTAHQKIVKVQDIITELRMTLNMEYPIAQNLADLYDFYYQMLLEANLQKNSDTLETVKGFLTELRSAWQQAVIMVETPAKPMNPVAEETAAKDMKQFNILG